jgi:hypothetical protein
MELHLLIFPPQSKILLHFATLHFLKKAVVDAGIMHTPYILSSTVSGILLHFAVLHLQKEENVESWNIGRARISSTNIQIPRQSLVPAPSEIGNKMQPCCSIKGWKPVCSHTA